MAHLLLLLFQKLGLQQEHASNDWEALLNSCLETHCKTIYCTLWDQSMKAVSFSPYRCRPQNTCMLNALLCHSAKTHSSQNLHGMTPDVVIEDD
jgi:hypothetical protein